MAGPVDATQRLRQAVRAHPALLVSRDADDRRGPETDQAARGADRRMRVGARNHRDARRALKAERLNVPPGPPQHFVPRGSQRGHVRHRRAGDEPDAGGAREPEQVEHPAGRDLFDRGHRRRQDVQRGILIPRRGEPVGRDGRRKAAAGHEPEVAWPRARHEPGLGLTSQPLDDRHGVLRPVGNRAAERGDEVREGGARVDGSRVDRVEEAAREIAGQGQQGLVHAQYGITGTARRCRPGGEWPGRRMMSAPTAPPGASCTVVGTQRAVSRLRGSR